MWHHVTSCDIMWHHVTSCDIMWHSSLQAAAAETLWQIKARLLRGKARWGGARRPVRIRPVAVHNFKPWHHVRHYRSPTVGHNKSRKNIQQHHFAMPKCKPSLHLSKVNTSTKEPSLKRKWAYEVEEFHSCTFHAPNVASCNVWSLLPLIQLELWLMAYCSHKKQDGNIQPTTTKSFDRIKQADIGKTGCEVGVESPFSDTSNNSNIFKHHWSKNIYRSWEVGNGVVQESRKRKVVRWSVPASKNW